METQPITEILTADLLVVGGGIAGITAALEAAETGMSVILIEKQHSLGGRVAQLDRYFPKLCPPACGLELNFRRLRINPRVKVVTGAVPAKIGGGAGNLTAAIRIEPRYVTEKCTACGDCEKACSVEVDDPFNFELKKAKAIRKPQELAFPNRYFIEPSVVADPKIKEIAAICPVGAIDLEMKQSTVTVNCQALIWASGWKPYDARRLADELNYGRVPNIVTNMEMERMKALSGPQGKITRPSDGGQIARAAFVQCAGSRDQNQLPYCSAVCCMASLKQSRYLREQYPDCEIHIFFIDARTPGRWEDFYVEVQNDPQTIIHRGKVAKIEPADGGQVTVTAENTVTGTLEHITVDLAILATGMEPNVKTEPIPYTAEVDEFGFVHNNGIPLIPAGVASGPKDVASSVQEATGAVIRSMKFIVRS